MRPRGVLIAALLALIAYGSTLRHWCPQHYAATLGLIVLLTLFGIMMNKSMKWANQTIAPKLYHLEESGPT